MCDDGMAAAGFKYALKMDKEKEQEKEKAAALKAIQPAAAAAGNEASK